MKGWGLGLKGTEVRVSRGLKDLHIDAGNMNIHLCLVPIRETVHAYLICALLTLLFLPGWLRRYRVVLQVVISGWVFLATPCVHKHTQRKQTLNIGK